MRLLFFTPSPESYMRAPLLAEDQVVCGPDYAEGKTAAGLRCHRTPLGDFDVSNFIESLTDEPYPDLVICLVDASWRCVPQGMARLRCPKVLLVADTHHLHTPIRRMVDYALDEKFDRTVILYGRHHALFFKAAGVQGLHWLPGLSFPYSEQQVDEAPRNKRRPVVALYGQISRIHVRRRALLETMAGARIPLSVQSGPQTACLPFYGQALVGFNASLNGDLNLRVFEILASGAALLNDRLGEGSGLERLLVQGRDYLAYENNLSLVAMARTLLADPAETQAMGSRGRRWLLEHYSERRRRELFHDIVNGIAVPEEFRIDDVPSVCMPDHGSAAWKATVHCYEALQELHRTQEQVTLCIAPELEPLWVPLARTLPRVHLAMAPADLDIVPAAADPTLPEYSRRSPGQPQLGTVTHSPAHEWIPRHVTPDEQNSSPAAGLPPPLPAIRSLVREGYLGDAFEQARLALGTGKEQAACLLLIAEVALLSGKVPLAAKLLNDARGQRASTEECRRLEQALQPAAFRLGAGTLLHQHLSGLHGLGYHEELSTVCSRVLSQNPEEQGSRRYLIRACMALSQFENALRQFKLLRRQRCPEDAELCLLAALACTRLGAPNDALQLQREAAETPPLRVQALCELTELHISLGQANEARRSLQLLEMLCPADGRFLLLREWAKTALGGKA